MVRMMRLRFSFDAIRRSVDFYGSFTPILTVPSSGDSVNSHEENSERVIELVFFFTFKSATEARRKITRLSKRSALFFVQIEAQLRERYAKMPRF